MTEKDSLLARRLGRLSVAGFLMIGLLVVMIFLAPLHLFAFLEAAWHLATGFTGFLKQNVARISYDAGTWAPGLAAFVLALAVGHCWLARWAVRKNRPWGIGSTLCAGLVLPVLFITAFLIPGAILQVRELAQVKWFERGYGSASSEAARQARDIAMAAFLGSDDSAQGEFPGSWEELRAGELLPINGERLRMPGLPAEPPLYLGGVLTPEADASLPLVISSPFRRDGLVWRWVVTVGLDAHEIRDDEVDGWLRRIPAFGAK
jgi:hypothetical protein